MQSTLCDMLGWINHNLESRILGEVSTTCNMLSECNIQTCKLYHSNGRKWGGIRDSCWQWKRSEKAGLKLSIQRTKAIVSSPITSRQVNVESMTHFIFLASKITVHGDWSCEIKIRFLLGRKAMTSLDRVLKSRDSIFANKFIESNLWSFQ